MLHTPQAAILQLFGMSVFYFAKKKKTDAPIFFLYYPLVIQRQKVEIELYKAGLWEENYLELIVCLLH